LIEETAARLAIEKYHPTSYIHHNNGSVEITNKLVLNCFRVMLSELRWIDSDWPLLIGPTKYFLNHKPQARLRGGSPLFVMTGRLEDNPVSLIWRNPSITNTVPISPARLDEIVSDFADMLAVVHKDVSSLSAKLRDIHNASKSQNLKSVTFEIGSFVLLAKDVTQLKSKLHFVWRGPYRVVKAISPYVYQVQDLIQPDLFFTSHVERMLLYDDRK